MEIAVRNGSTILRTEGYLILVRKNMLIPGKSYCMNYHTCKGRKQYRYLKKNYNDLLARNAASKLTIQKSSRFIRRITLKSDTNHPTLPA